jgi:hypothetical protein
MAITSSQTVVTLKYLTRWMLKSEGWSQAAVDLFNTRVQTSDLWDDQAVLQSALSNGMISSSAGMTQEDVTALFFVAGGYFRSPQHDDSWAMLRI